MHDFGHKEVFKKGKEELHLRSDSFVVESNVHFPTDYNLSWDCARRCLESISRYRKKYRKPGGMEEAYQLETRAYQYRNI